MVSEVVNTGAVLIDLALNQYAAGDAAALKYRTAADTTTITGETWVVNAQFTSQGYVQVRVEASL